MTVTITKLRRDKDAKSIRIDTALYGPLNDAEENPQTQTVEIKFYDVDIDVGKPGSSVTKASHWVAEIDLIPGKKYLLSWKMWGELGAGVEYLIDKQDNLPVANFNSIAKDKIPGAGTGHKYSRETPSGMLVWINAKHIWG